MANVTLAEVREALTTAGYREAVVKSGGASVTTAGFRAYEHEGTVRLGYWSADGEFEGAHPDAPAVHARYDAMEAAYAGTLAEAGFKLSRRGAILIVTGRKARTYTAELTGAQIFSFAELVRRLCRADVERPLRQDLAAALMAFEALLPEPSEEDGDAYLAAVQAGELPAWGMDLLPLAGTHAELEEAAETLRKLNGEG